MGELVISVRYGRAEDAASLSRVFDAAWREAYQGIIPAVALSKMLTRRGPRWWRAAVGRSRALVVLDVGERIAGYAAYGRCRERVTKADGEIDELYLAPEYQGLGFGTRLFKAVRNDLRDRGARRIAVWALEDNERALAFYRKLGGRPIARGSEQIGGVALGKVAFLFG
jgi:ribosomal protein S18 acetylase RimI-like enzyme